MEGAQGSWMRSKWIYLLPWVHNHLTCPKYPLRTCDSFCLPPRLFLFHTQFIHPLVYFYCRWTWTPFASLSALSRALHRSKLSVYAEQYVDHKLVIIVRSSSSFHIFCRVCDLTSALSYLISGLRKINPSTIAYLCIQYFQVHMTG